MKKKLTKEEILNKWLIFKLRRLSLQWPERYEAIKRIKIKDQIGFFKNGKPKFKVMVYCEICGILVDPKKIEVDHIQPAVPVNIPQKHLSLNTYINNLFCNVDGFQGLCKLHHDEKTLKENILRDEWLTKEKYIVYRTINKINKKSYVGIHKCIDYDDGYLGSGTLLKRAIKKYGKENFNREILYCFDNLKDALAKEKEIVNEEYLTNEDVYNIAIGGNGLIPSTAKKVICHQTGNIFTSIVDAAKWLDIDHASISRVVNCPDKPVRNLHFFTTDVYDSKINVTFPRNENIRSIVHLNTKTIYKSIKECCEKLELNYKAVRNSLCFKDKHGLYSYKDHYFLYEEEYDPTTPIMINEIVILCVELNKEFDSYNEAAKFLKKENINHGGIAIGKAARTNGKMYGYNWKLVNKIKQL